MRTSTKSLVALTGVCALTISLSGCGTDNATTGSESKKAETVSVKGAVAGAGASSQKSAVEAWKAGFKEVAPDATITYDPVGSGAGITQFLGGGVAFAGTDQALTPEEVEKSKAVCKDSSAINLPVYVSPVAVAFNLEGIKSLNLRPEVIAKIFRGEITKWNDPAIAADNKDAHLPDTQIIPIHRADKSGTTENFTEYLHAAAPSVWTDKPSKDWPVNGGESGDKTAGVVQALKAAPGTIGYIDASQVSDLGSAALQSGSGFVPYSAEAAAKVVASAETEPGRAPSDLALKLNRTPTEEGIYPLVLVSYYAVCPTYKDSAQAPVVKEFIKFVVSEKGQKMAAESAGSAPLSAEMTEKVTKILNEIK
ncbi:MAG: phosphate ABC transporter substrate-binding protein PstS [Actinomycetaceae bacterium]|nr:phosphate ABC transporter substrate-binding protein PstS [Actinomycetaceae bacterium]